jgi:hypothetical protein
MKIPTKCPCCHDPLLSSYQESRSGPGKWKKTCANKLSHKFTCMHDDNSEELILIGVELSSKVYATWWLDGQKLVISSVVPPLTSIYSSRESYIWLPYFEPDISNYKKLIDKLKTYLVFS